MTRHALFAAMALAALSFLSALACGNLATAISTNDAGADDDAAYAGYFETDAALFDVAPALVLGVPDTSAAPDVVGLGQQDSTAPTTDLDVGSDADDAGCTAPLAAGSLAIDELMIESVAGTGDYGEWVEVENSLACAVNLRGLHGECATGATVHTFDVTGNVWIPAGGTFLVADSSDPAINHYLPGTLVVWTGQPGDVLRNEGGTVTLMWNGSLVDTVTYPSRKLVVGASIAFPSNCMPTQITDWTTWQTSISSWFPGFDGTPNAPNTDVTCP